MCLRERQYVFGRDDVSSGETMWLPETGCLGHKLTSRSSPDLFPASIRIKMMREIHWSCQNCPEHMKIHENQPPTKKIDKKYIFFLKKIRRCKIENSTILRVQTIGLPKSRGARGGALGWGHAWVITIRKGHSSHSQTDCNASGYINRVRPQLWQCMARAVGLH